MLATLVLATVIAVPVAAWANHQFDDVGDSDTFHADIDWMEDTGVTAGCNPPTNDKYCPAQFVTREQMAAFMHRLESEGVLLPAEGKATDADRLDGHDSTFYRLRCTDGRLLFLGMCFEPEPRVQAVHGDATTDCAEEAMRLPSQGELRSLRELVGTNGVTMAEWEWTDDVADTNKDSVFHYAWAGTAGRGALPATVNLQYRCVGGPTG